MAKEAVYTFGLIAFAVVVQIKGKSCQTSFFKLIKTFSVQMFLIQSSFQEGKQSSARQTH